MEEILYNYLKTVKDYVMAYQHLMWGYSMLKL